MFTINRRINTIFAREGLQMAYPQIQVRTEKN
jgi:small-conductance mechanosensitive channel